MVERTPTVATTYDRFGTVIPSMLHDGEEKSELEEIESAVELTREMCAPTGIDEVYVLDDDPPEDAKLYDTGFALMQDKGHPLIDGKSSITGHANGTAPNWTVVGTDVNTMHLSLLRPEPDAGGFSLDPAVVLYARRREYMGGNKRQSQTCTALTCNCVATEAKKSLTTMECRHIEKVMKRGWDFSPVRMVELLGANATAYRKMNDEGSPAGYEELDGTYGENANLALEWDVLIFSDPPTHAKVHIEWKDGSSLAQVTVPFTRPGRPPYTPQVMLEVGYIDPEHDTRKAVRALYIDFLCQLYTTPTRWRRCDNRAHENSSWVDWPAWRGQPLEPLPEITATNISMIYPLLRDIHFGMFEKTCTQCKFDSGVPVL